MSVRQMFAKKKLKDLLAEAAGDNRLKRVLGPIALTSLGVGGVIGAGIFVATGSAASGVAGPALMVSYIVAGVTCIFAALCYAEFASMAPVAGSAYTYAYTTLGELLAWIIGWDLVLEYAVGAAAVANGWSGYFQSLLQKVGIALPFLISGAPANYDQGFIVPNVIAEYSRADIDAAVLKGEVDPDTSRNAVTVKPKVILKQPSDETTPTALWADGKTREVNGKYWAFEVTKQTEKGERSTQRVIVGALDDPAVESKLLNRQRALCNLPAILITALVTAFLVKGISESANFNTVMVLIKTAAVIFVICVGAFYIKPENWEPFAPYGWSGVSFFGVPVLGEPHNGKPVGMLAGAAIIFFAYIGFDSVSTHAEEAKNPQRDVPIGIIASLILCTVLYIGVVAVLTGMVPYNMIDKDAGVSDAFAKAGLGWAEAIISVAGVAGITSVLLVNVLSAPRVFLAMARDGLIPKAFFADVHPKFQTPWKSTILVGLFVAVLGGMLPIDALLDLTNIGTLFAFVIVCAAVLLMRKIDPQAERPFRCPFVPVIPIMGILTCLLLMFSLPAENWYRLFGWLALGLVIYFGYGRHHSVLGKELRNELAHHGASPHGTLD